MSENRTDINAVIAEEWRARMEKAEAARAAATSRAELAEQMVERLAKVVLTGLISEDGIEGTDAEGAFADAETLLGRKLTPERCGACKRLWEECGGH